MCNYEYRQHETCGHQVIELYHYCQEVLWKAGMTGRLAPCPEQLYISRLLKIVLPLTDEEEGEHFWKGYGGFCKHCQSDYEMPKMPNSTNFNDTAMSTTFDHGPTANPSANLSFQTLPFIYTPWLFCDIPELLSITEHMDHTDFGLGPRVFFPENLGRYDLTSSIDAWRLQWESLAHINGNLLRNFSMNRFARSGGLTRSDWDTIVKYLAMGEEVYDIWRELFKPRGMDVMAFLSHNAQIQSIQANIAKQQKEWDTLCAQMRAPRPLAVPHLQGDLQEAPQFQAAPELQAAPESQAAPQSQVPQWQAPQMQTRKRPMAPSPPGSDDSFEEEDDANDSDFSEF